MAIIKVENEELLGSNNSYVQDDYLHDSCGRDATLTNFTTLPHSNENHVLGVAHQDNVILHSLREVDKKSHAMVGESRNVLAKSGSSYLLSPAKGGSFVSINQNYCESDLNEYELFNVVDNSDISVKTENSVEEDSSTATNLVVRKALDMNHDAPSNKEAETDGKSTVLPKETGKSNLETDVNNPSCSYEVGHKSSHVPCSESESNESRTNQQNAAGVQNGPSRQEVESRHATETVEEQGLLDLSSKRRVSVDPRPNITEIENQNPLDLRTYIGSDRRIITSNRNKVSTVLRKNTVGVFNEVPLDLSCEGPVMKGNTQHTSSSFCFEERNARKLRPMNNRCMESGCDINIGIVSVPHSCLLIPSSRAQSVSNMCSNTQPGDVSIPGRDNRSENDPCCSKTLSKAKSSQAHCVRNSSSIAGSSGYHCRKNYRDRRDSTARIDKETDDRLQDVTNCKGKRGCCAQSKTSLCRTTGKCCSCVRSGTGDHVAMNSVRAHHKNQVNEGGLQGGQDSETGVGNRDDEANCGRQKGQCSYAANMCKAAVSSSATVCVCEENVVRDQAERSGNTFEEFQTPRRDGSAEEGQNTCRSNERSEVQENEGITSERSTQDITNSAVHLENSTRRTSTELRKVRSTRPSKSPAVKCTTSNSNGSSITTQETKTLVSCERDSVNAKKCKKKFIHNTGKGLPKQSAVESSTNPFSTTVHNSGIEDTTEEKLSCALCGVEMENIECLSDHFLWHFRSGSSPIEESSDDNKAKRNENLVNTDNECQSSALWNTSKTDCNKIHSSAETRTTSSVVQLEMKNVVRDTSQHRIMYNNTLKLSLVNGYNGFIFPNRRKRSKKQKTNFRCVHCAKEFVYHQVFVCHNIIHRGHKQYSCAACNKKFAFKKTLAAHLLLEHLYKKNGIQVIS